MERPRMCPHCRALNDRSARACAECGYLLSPRPAPANESSDLLGGLIPQGSFVTSMVLLLNVALYAAAALRAAQAGDGTAWMNMDGRTLVEFGAKWSQFIRGGEWWRLVTAGFLHGGLVHILMNSWTLLDVGAHAEGTLGAKRLVVVYFVGTVAGFLASTLFSPGSLSVGASAGIFGLIGAMIAIGTRFRGFEPLRGLYARFAAYGLVLGLLPGLRIDNAAHLGGLVGGFVAAYVAGLPQPGRASIEWIWTVLAGVCLALTVASFALMFLGLVAG